MERQTECIDCLRTFTYDYVMGVPRQRCDTCRDIRKSKTDAAKARRWRDANRERAREQWNKHNRKRLADPEFVAALRVRRRERIYGLTQAEFDSMLVSQGHLCAICDNPHIGVGAQLHIDHNHTTGVVRALLCGKCNTLIGLADDSPERLELAAAYLRRHAT